MMRTVAFALFAFLILPACDSSADVDTSSIRGTWEASTSGSGPDTIVISGQVLYRNGSSCEGPYTLQAAPSEGPNAYLVIGSQVDDAVVLTAGTLFWGGGFGSTNQAYEKVSDDADSSCN